MGPASWLSDGGKLEKKRRPLLKTHPWADDSTASRALAHAELQPWNPFRSPQHIPAGRHVLLGSLSFITCPIGASKKSFPMLSFISGYKNKKDLNLHNFPYPNASFVKAS